MCPTWSLIGEYVDDMLDWMYFTVLDARLDSTFSMEDHCRMLYHENYKMMEVG
jgi:hypothetical protein